MTTGAVHDGQKEFFGQEAGFHSLAVGLCGRSALWVTAWSGDVNSDFLTFRRQIPAGLNFALFRRFPIGLLTSEALSLAIRTTLRIANCSYAGFSSALSILFCECTEPARTTKTSYGLTGRKAQKILVNFDHLRYRMLPYIYSLAWKTTSEAYTAHAPTGNGISASMSARRISANSSCTARHFS